MDSQEGHHSNEQVLQAISFVNEYTVPPPMQHSAPGVTRAQSVQFAIYTALGFCVTMGVIIVLLSAYLLIRRFWAARRRSSGRGRRPSTVAVPPLVEPRDFVVVVQPGGYTDVACKEHDMQRARQQMLHTEEAKAKKALNLVADSTGRPTDNVIPANFPVSPHHHLLPNHDDSCSSSQCHGNARI